MITKLEAFMKPQLRDDLPDIRPGDTVRVFQRIPAGKGKEKIQIFEGLVLLRKHGKGINATITVRKVISSVGVEKIFPVHSPNIEKIELVKRGKVRRAKLYYLRTAKGRKARLKRKEIKEVIVDEKVKEKEIKEEVKKPEEKPEKKLEEKKEEKAEEKTEEAEKLEEKKEEKTEEKVEEVEKEKEVVKKSE